MRGKSGRGRPGPKSRVANGDKPATEKKSEGGDQGEEGYGIQISNVESQANVKVIK